MTEEAKNMLWDYYSRKNYPHLVAHHGPWDIYAQEMPPTRTTHCAAIPTDRDSGHLPSQYGTFSHVLTIAATSPTMEILPEAMAGMSGRASYEADCRRTPTYHDGTPRTPWEKLSEIAKLSWTRTPTPTPTTAEA